MKNFEAKTLSWKLEDGVVELALHHEPCNEIGSQTLEDLERFADELGNRDEEASVLIVHSTLRSGFSAGADLRELYHRSQGLKTAERIAGVRDFLTRIHRVLNAIDASPLVTIAAVHGVTFGGGLELALACDLIVADKMARFCFPELRLGLIPGFGGIPRLKRDLGNAVVRDLLLTGRSINATKALAVGLVSQVAAEGEALRLARSTAAQIKIEHSILGSVMVDAAEAVTQPLHLQISDSIWDATSDERDALSDDDGKTANANVTIARCTVFGHIRAHEIALAENCIFSGQVHVAHRQTGCIRFCYVPPDSRTPRRYECQPDLVTQAASQQEVDRVRPRFNSVRYGTPTYCQLAESCAEEITRGADDESEMGVFHDLFQPQRAANLRARLDEYTPAGMDAGIIYGT